MKLVKKFTTIGILGRTNAGKSTLLNSLTQKKIAAVASKVNTTRTPLTGFCKMDSSQFLLLDAPGVCQARTNLDNVILNNIAIIIQSSDLVWWLIDVNDLWQKDNQILVKMFQDFNKPLFLLINKIDLIDKNKLIEKIAFFQTKFTFTEIVPVSAKKQINFHNLKNATLKHLTAQKTIVKNDVFSLNTFQEIAKEVIREQIILQTQEELPHQTILAVDDCQTKGKTVFLQITIFVATKSQKGIVLGKNGNKIKKIRLTSQQILTKLWKKTLLLFLKVKVHKNWYQDLHFLQMLNIPWKGWF